MFHVTKNNKIISTYKIQADSSGGKKTSLTESMRRQLHTYMKEAYTCKLMWPNGEDRKHPFLMISGQLPVTETRRGGPSAVPRPHEC